MKKKDFILIYVASHISEATNTGIAFGKDYGKKLRKRQQEELDICISDAKKFWKLIKNK